MSPRGAVAAPLLPILYAIILIALVPATQALKYEHWFFWYDRPGEGTLTELSTGLCKEPIEAYWAAATRGSFNGSTAVTWCYLAEDCMLANLRPSYLQNYQAGAVILGILPTLLASLGPRIAEISLLSTHRPFLTFLLSIGAPSVWPTRIFNYDDPANCLGSGLNLAVVKPQRRYRARFYSALQYVLVIGSIVNLFQVAIELGTLTVVSWSCALDYLPLAWAIIPFGIHLVAAVSYHIEVAQTETQIRREMAIENGARSPLIRSMTFLQERANLSWLQKEFALCANQPKGLEAVLKQKKTSQFTVFLNCVASLMAFFHLLFGTMLFSSLIFIAVWDILNSVIWRYLISTVVCRLVLLVELAGLREQNEKENDGVQRRLTGLGERVNGMANRVDTLMNEREVAQGRPKERETQRSFAERSSEKAGGEVQQAKKTKRLSLKRPLDEIRAARESETE